MKHRPSGGADGRVLPRPHAHVAPERGSRAAAGATPFCARRPLPRCAPRRRNGRRRADEQRGLAGRGAPHGGADDARARLACRRRSRSARGPRARALGRERLVDERAQLGLHARHADVPRGRGAGAPPRGQRGSKYAHGRHDAERRGKRARTLHAVIARAPARPARRRARAGGERVPSAPAPSRSGPHVVAADPRERGDARAGATRRADLRRRLPSRPRAARTTPATLPLPPPARRGAVVVGAPALPADERRAVAAERHANVARRAARARAAPGPRGRAAAGRDALVDPAPRPRRRRRRRRRARRARALGRR